MNAEGDGNGESRRGRRGDGERPGGGAGDERRRAAADGGAAAETTVFIVFDAAHAALAEAVAERLKARGLATKPSDALRDWPILAWSVDRIAAAAHPEPPPRPGFLRSAFVRAARDDENSSAAAAIRADCDAAPAVVLIWGEDPEDDSAFRREADLALADLRLAAVLASPSAATRLQRRFASRLLPGDAGLDAVADAAEAALIERRTALSRDVDVALEDIDRSALDRLARLEARVRDLSDLGLRDEALTAREQVVAARRRVIDAAPTPRRRALAERKLAASLLDLAERLADLDRDAEAISAAREAVALHRKLRSDAERERSRPRRQGRAGAAADGRPLDGRADGPEEPPKRRAGAPGDALGGTAGGDVALARGLTIEAMSAARLRRWSVAARAVEGAVDIYRKLRDQHPALVRSRLAMLLGLLAEARLGENRKRAAEAAAIESLTLFRSLARGDDPSDLENLAAALLRLAAAQTALSRRDQAAAATAEAVDLRRDADAPDEDLAAALLAHGRAIAAQGRRDEAAGALDEAVRVARGLTSEDPEAHRALLAEALAERAALLRRSGQAQEAASLAEEGLRALDDADFDLSETADGAPSSGPRKPASEPIGEAASREEAEEQRSGGGRDAFAPMLGGATETSLTTVAAALRADEARRAFETEALRRRLNDLAAGRDRARRRALTVILLVVAAVCAVATFVSSVTPPLV